MTDRYTLHDWLGSARGTEDATSTTTYPNAYLYDGYGREIAFTGAATTNQRYGGAWGYQSEVGTEDGFGTGLVYTQQRYYDPETGGFVSPDPIGFAGGLNLYAYCDGDPIGCVDPEGLRGLTSYEQQLLTNLRNTYVNFSQSGRGIRSKTMNGVEEKFRAYVAGLGPNSDPANLKAAKWAIRQYVVQLLPGGPGLGDKNPWSEKGGAGGKNWLGKVKCNLFTQQAYAEGAGAPYGDGEDYSANDLSTVGKSIPGLSDASPQGPLVPGDIVSFAGKNHGHAGINIADGMFIAASSASNGVTFWPIGHYSHKPGRNGVFFVRHKN